jgi:hypothetical protein
MILGLADAELATEATSLIFLAIPLRIRTCGNSTAPLH